MSSASEIVAVENTNHVQFDKRLHTVTQCLVHSETTTFASIFLFRLTEIGPPLQPSDAFPGL